VGGVLLALIEGAGILVSRAMTSLHEKQQAQMMEEQRRMAEKERYVKMKVRKRIMHVTVCS
jgi:4-hydroxyphenylpyruvate dioxygenase-like putative hemolysin